MRLRLAHIRIYKEVQFRPVKRPFKGVGGRKEMGGMRIGEELRDDAGFRDDVAVVGDCGD